MIYSGTFPAKPEPPAQLSVIDVGNTGRGHVARSRVRHGRRAGSSRKPAQAMLSLGRYWTDQMPGGDKAWWVAHAAEFNIRTRQDVNKEVTGFSLFLSSNIAALCRGSSMVKLPTSGDLDYGSEIALDSVSASTNKLKVYCCWLGDPLADRFIEYFISAINPWNVTQDEPMKQTQLFATVIPNFQSGDPEPPVPPQYFSLPFDVVAGNRVSFHIQYRRGWRDGPPIWQGEAWPTQIRTLTVT